MYQLGKYNSLEVIKLLDFGAYLNGGDEIEILMPLRYVPENTQPGDRVRVFVYLDSEDRLIATTETPVGTVGETAALPAVATDKNGIFMYWGLLKDLLVPFSQQNRKMEVGGTYLVRILIDEQSGRIYGSSLFDELENNKPADLEEEDEVSVQVWEFTDMGTKVIVNEKFIGMIFRNETFRNFNIGDVLTGYVKKIRTDNKLDIALRKRGFEEVEDAGERVMEALVRHQGFLPLTDNSSPVAIQETLQMSKKTFKRAIGVLYRERRIRLLENGIQLIAEE
jgi:uncharacterized protein